MRLDWVELRDFRNHMHTRIDPVPDGLIVVVGPNGEGKTNLLEGIHFLYALGSPRTSTNGNLVREGAERGLRPRRSFETLEGQVLVEVEIPAKGASRVQVNRSPVRRKRDLRRQVRAVLFGPFDLPIVIGRSLEAAHVPGRGRDGAVAAARGALHRLRPRAAAAQPSAEGVGPAGRSPPAGSRRGTRSS